MTKHNLEEFKGWLQEQDSKKQNIIHPLKSVTGAVESWFTTILPRIEGAEDNWLYHLRQQSHGIKWVVDKWLTELGQWEEQKQLADQIVEQVQKKVEELQQELATERETTQQALQTSQEWHERQKAEIIEIWKEKLTTYRNQRKTSLRQEINLIREVLND